MQKLIKYITNLIYKPLLVKYLSSTRVYIHKGIRLLIPPEVFHPGFFFSTKLLLAYVNRHSLRGKSFLELGAGSGLIQLTPAILMPAPAHHAGTNAAMPSTGTTRCDTTLKR